MKDCRHKISGQRKEVLLGTGTAAGDELFPLTGKP